MDPLMRTRRKLNEAKFFLNLMEGSVRQATEFNYYLSAFISSARSVTWIMRAEYGRISGWATWYASKRPAHKVQKLLKDLNAVRVRSEKTSPLDTYVAVTLEFSSDDLAPEVRKWLLSSEGEEILLKPVREKVAAASAEITHGAIGTVTSVQHELPEFEGENILDVCRRYIAQIDELVGECESEFQTPMQ